MKARNQPRRGLVLGCGGVLGAAWSIAALDNLRQALDWDPREAQILVGTSAGAVLAALLGAGTGVDRLLASQRGEAADCVWNHDTDSGGWLPPLPGLGFTGLPLLRHGLRGTVTPFTAALGLLPRGRADMRPFMRLIDSVTPSGGWAPHPATWIMAVDSASGRRVAFGAPGAPQASLTDAVCASYAVPGWCPPAQIGGRRYLDGGIVSPTSADFVLGAGLDEVVILAPMASRDMDRPAALPARIERRVRRLMTRIVDAEQRRLEQSGVRVIRLEPGPEDLRAIGYNMMDPRRRLHVFETALRSTAGAVRAAQA